MPGRLQDAILRDTRANQPLATAVSPGAIYYVTDEQVTERVSDDGLSWEDISDAGSATPAITQLTGDVTAGPGSGSQAATIANGAVTNAKLRDSGALSVIGRASNSTGAVADITAAADDRLLTRISSALAWTQITLGMAAANLWTFAKLQQIATGKILGRGTAATGDIEELTPANGIETTSTPGIRQTVAARTRSVNFVIDGGGSAITTGVKGDFRFPVAGTITKVSLLADQSGSIVIDIWKAAFATGTSPTVANTITAAAKPTISATVNSEDGTLTGWTTSVSAGDCFRINVDSATTVTRVTMALEIVVTG